MANGEFTWEESGDAIVIRGLGARITMARAAGSWTHHLAIGDDQVRGPDGPPLISSVETDPDHADPSRVVSPVYQELQRLEFAGDQVRGFCLLLTGHLFQHHFSAAVSLLRDPSDPAWIVLEYDIADRCRAPVTSLAATYLVRLGGGDLADAAPEAIRWNLGGQGSEASQLEMKCDPPGSLAMAEAGRGAARVQALAALHPTLFTHRLRYRWRWHSPR
jgi:hypothetical protein